MALQNKIVALLPAHNEAGSIATTLRALAAQTRVPDQWPGAFPSGARPDRSRRIR
jgi:hypothetical protein